MADCRYCHTTLPKAGALLCAACKSYQDPWRNYLVFGAGITGFVALVASAITFGFNQASSAYKELFWKDEATILELQTGVNPHQRIVIANSGDGPIFISQLAVYWRGGSMSFALDRSLEPGRVDIVDDLFSEKSIALNKKFGTAGYIGSKSGELGEKQVEQADLWSDDTEPPPPCILVSLFNNKNPDLERIRDRYLKGPTKLVTRNETATLVFYSIRTGRRHDVAVPVVAVFVKSNRGGCSTE